MIDCEISPLEDHEDFAEICATWAYNEWGSKRGRDFNKIVQRYRNGAQTYKLPITLLAINKKNGMPVGMISLWASEDAADPALSPWLASLFVCDEFRGKGIGKTLINKIEQKATELGYAEIYLQTDEALNYYSRLEYEPLKKLLNNQTVFRKKLVRASDLA